MKVYIAGPMTGFEDNNFPAFNAAARQLRAAGVEVVSPAETTATKHEMSWSDWMRVDIVLIAGCDAIAVLPGWEQSKGARLEVHIATELGLPVIDAATMADVRVTPLKSLEDLFADIHRWQCETFGVSNTKAKAKHLLLEAAELLADPTDGMEIADCLILLVGIALGQGLDLRALVSSKLEINKARNWGQPDADGVVEHIHADEAVAP